MSTIKVGDKVKIRKSSEFYDNGRPKANPVDVVGVVTSLNGTGEHCGLPIDVQWPDLDWVNDYAEEDLEIVE